MSTLNAALALAAKGIAVFPLGPNKRPMPGQIAAKSAATTDPVVIENWHLRWPGALLVALTGAREDGGIGVVLDFDVGEHKDGVASLPAAEARLGVLPPTLTCSTPSGGQHRHFRWPGGKIRNTVAELGPGIDSKGTKGSIIMPPSVSLTGSYAWTIRDEGIAELPEGWVAALREKPRPASPAPPLRGNSTAYAYAALRSELQRIVSTQTGRHNALIRGSFVIGQLVGAGALTQSEAERALIDAGLSVGLPEYEVRSTVRDGLVNGAEQPRESVR